MNKSRNQKSRLPTGAVKGDSKLWQFPCATPQCLANEGKERKIERVSESVYVCFVYERGKEENSHSKTNSKTRAENHTKI
jgi:hypothetical protein